MSNPFTNPDSFVLPSMNRVRLVDLPGLAIPLAWQNKPGDQLLGQRALLGQILRKTAVLHLNPSSPNLIRQFDTCFESDEDIVRETAVAIAKEYGRKLAYHQLVLKRGDVVNRVVRPDWQAVHWAHWAQIEHVWLGGGLMAGHLGLIAAAEAQQFIRQHGFPEYSLTVSPFAANLPLIGAARIAPADAQSMLVFDFGQTSIKRGVAHYEAGSLVTLEALSSLPAACPGLWYSRDESFAVQTRDRILRVVNETWQEIQTAGCQMSSTIAVILACYLLHGQPRHEDWGCYGRLQQFSSHLQTYLAEQVSQQLAQTIQIELLHDGQAAALPYAGQPHCAVMTFGTALGIGFPPESDVSLRPLDFQFS
ncbi:MAG: hypothetical protein IAF02_23225 [Anaerolineae bacterium]|nr:hypothetical protein [Anaerolineae bacterium]